MRDRQSSVAVAPLAADIAKRDRRVSIPSGPGHLLEQMLPANWRKKTIIAAAVPSSEEATPRAQELRKAETVKEHADSASYFLSKFQGLNPPAAKGIVATPPKLSVWAVRAAAKADFQAASILNSRLQLSKAIGFDRSSDMSMFDNSSRRAVTSCKGGDDEASESSAVSSENVRAGFVPSPAPPKSRAAVPTLSALMPSIPREKKSGFPSTARNAKKKAKSLPQHRRDSVEEYMQQIPSLSSIGVSSSTSEAPAVRAALFLSSVDPSSMESDLQVPNEMPTVSLPPPIGFRNCRDSHATSRRVSFSDNAVGDSPMTSTINHCSEPIPIVELRTRGETRLREPQSRRTLVARMRFDKSVPCEMVALLPGGVLKVLSGFQLRVPSKTGEVVVTKRLQKKVYRLDSLSFIDASKTCLATAKRLTLSDSQSSNPLMWDQVHVDKLQSRGTCVCLYSRGKTLPCMPVFEVIDDKHDFLELLAINAQATLSPEAANALSLLL